MRCRQRLHPWAPSAAPYCQVEQEGAKGDQRNHVHTGMRNPPLSSWAPAAGMEEMLPWESSVTSLLESPHEDPACPRDTWTNIGLTFYILFPKYIFIFIFQAHQ